MKLAIIGDYDPDFAPHPATSNAIAHSLNYLNTQLQFDWITTDEIEKNFEKIIEAYSGFWIAPGSPYKSMAGALKIIKHARENNIPTFGTCGGFQHMVIEFARNVMRIKDAEHAEYDPYASNLVINPLSCSLKGQKLTIKIPDKNSITYSIFNTDHIEESYYCNFGLNPVYQEQVDANGFKIAGTDASNEARILELEGHSFFIATLFVPQANSSFERPHKLISAFISCIENKVKDRL